MDGRGRALPCLHVVVFCKVHGSFDATDEPTLDCRDTKQRKNEDEREILMGGEKEQLDGGVADRVSGWSGGWIRGVSTQCFPPRWLDSKLYRLLNS